MLRKSPSGALSPYYYKGGYFHGIHYGSYFEDSDALFDMMDKEEEFILKSPEQRRINIDLYETFLTPTVIERFLTHIENIKPRIVKLAICTDKKSLQVLKKAISKNKELSDLCCFFTTDMEEGKTWLVSDH
ncbi:MAG: hypothetical protein PWP07_1609 [Epulopiscium sp.]|jgi:hypothetical protein|uniref:STAS/SEC14 domain-containing protein n=1 Tax=Defluviitalea raffinosedens TaxID=1450156 RepID=A0A7C8LRW5_9FIRM|nr:hypothetical protein [Defluviitalea raffinosedens]MBZ4669567.1 hypothetical protein [Defluviitaleaceae bacterium]MDK2788364.1 hypothetical protein [Candidatus Epulonipiscium sp.]KAE9629435.1 hypothetical protein GND95_13130 [Defluviitalea raffinosedens]MBM7686674.1 hypothetical protein [Defluviitalea raffinosedens]HHW66431.1 hypothetical protein [Candidatus Epulonipiscium sp.]